MLVSSLDGKLRLFDRSNGQVRHIPCPSVSGGAVPNLALFHFEMLQIF